MKIMIFGSMVGTLTSPKLIENKLQARGEPSTNVPAGDDSQS